jgi:prophage endopeptidase
MVSAQAQTRQVEMQSQVAAIDQQHTQELKNAQAQNDALRRDLAVGTRRVFVNATCPTGGNTMSGTATATATSLADDAGAAELDPATAQALAGIAADGDDAIRALGALQQYVSTVCIGGRNGR